MLFPKRLLTVVVATVLPILAVEGALRVLYHDESFEGARKLRRAQQNKPGRPARFTVDRELGFRPIPGAGHCGPYGTKNNRYDIKKSAGVVRLLFIGDSVTSRSRIIDALAAEYGGDRYEYWNGGVGSFSMVQVANYYIKVTHVVEPDHVIVSFHNNDFETTPVAFFNSEGRLQVYAPKQPRRVVPWFFEWSYLYRWYLGRTGKDLDRVAIEDEVRDSLKRIRDFAAGRGSQLSCILLPVFAPRDTWSKDERHRYSKSLVILDGLGIRTLELIEPLDAALRDGIDIQQTPGDRLHPSRAAGEYFARYLRAKELLLLVSGDRERSLDRAEHEPRLDDHVDRGMED